MNFKNIILVFFAFNIVSLSDANSVFASTVSMRQFDKSVMINKKLVAAQKYIAKGDFVAAQSTLNSLLKLDPNNSKAKELLNDCESGIIKQKQQIYQLYIDACNAGTKSALENFISKYPNSEYVSMATSRIEDYSLWQTAKEQNTISAYNTYLSKSTILAYKDEANMAIKNIQVEKDWNNCKNSNDEDKLSAFIQNNPLSSFVNQAKYRLNILRGERYYSANNYNLAYSYLKDANSYQTLSGLPAQHYKDINAKREFDDVISSSDVVKVRSYFNTLSQTSPYYNLTSNRLAALLGASLSIYSSEYSINEAMSYVKDEKTKALVKRYIDKVKSDKAYYEHQKRVAARKAWWKNRFMTGWNFHVDYLDDITALGTGLKFRFGRWNDVVNFLFGIECSYLSYSRDDDDYQLDDSSDLPVALAIEIPVGLRFNLFKLRSIFEGTSLYIGCNAAFGFNIVEGDYLDVNKQTFSIEPQFGLACNKFDLGIYYKKYLKDQGLFKYTNDHDQRIGCFFTWFFSCKQ